MFHPPLFRSRVETPVQQPTGGVRGSHARQAWASRHPVCPACRRDRGSVLILVVVVLVLIALLGAAWLSFARTQRIAIHGVETSNIDLVMNATVSYLGQVLRDDLFNDSGELFDGTTDEGIDYPSVNTSVNYDVDTDLDPATAAEQAEGGIMDDTWLASTKPDFTDPADPEWPKITDVNGIFMRLPDTGGPTQPDLYPVSNSSYLRESIGVRIDGGSSLSTVGTNRQILGADADGDGILDSRWTWAPLPQMAGVRYVMAARIIDNSALLNANVALPMGNWNAGSSTFVYSSLNTEPRGWYPTDVGLGRFIAFHNGATSLGDTTFKSQLDQFIDYRLVNAATNPVQFNPSGSSGERVHYWREGARFYGDEVDSSITGTLADYIDDRLTNNDEIELRYRNGLNRNTTTDIEDASNGMPELLRAGANETDYTDVPGVGGTAPDNIEDYYNENPRLWLTTRSGASVYAPRLPGETTAVPIRTDLNDTLGAIRDAMTLAVNSLTLSNLLPPGLSGLSATDFVDQLTANIQDYADNDTVLTQVGNRFGMEPLPFIAEFYSQAHYEVTNVALDTGVTPNEDVAEISIVGRVGWAVELRNPFNTAVNLDGVQLWIDGSQVGPGSIADLPNAPMELLPDEVLILWREGNADGAGGDDDFSSLFAAAETYDNTNTYTHQIAKITGSPANADLPLKTDNGDAWATDRLDVELRCQAASFTPPNSLSAASFVTWPYQTFKVESYPQQIEERKEIAVAPTLPSQYAVGDDYYAQTTYVSVGNRLNLLEFTATEVESSGRNSTGNPMPLDGSKLTSLNASGDYIAIGTAIKDTAGGVSDAPTANIDPASNQIIFSRDDDEMFRFNWELAQIAFLGPNAGQTIADIITGNTASTDQVSDFQLSFGLPGEVPAATSVANIGDDNAVPDALLLIERFTTLDPGADGVDNDGDGDIDEDSELFVPGTINLNTVTMEVLEHILPYPVPNADHTAIAEAILRYRDMHEVGDSSASVDRDADAQAIAAISDFRTGRPGIAHLGELSYVLDSGTAGDFINFPNPSPDGLAVSISTNGDDSFWVYDEGDTNQVPIDFDTGDDTSATFPDRTQFEIPSALSQSDLGVIDDREEQIEFMKRLAQIASVRSDVFTAYVVLRGYPADDFRDGPVESAQFMVVYSRGDMAEADDEVKVLGYFVLSKN